MKNDPVLCPGPPAVHSEMLGLPLDLLPPDEVIERLVERGASGVPAYCCVANVQQFVLGHDNPAHREVLWGANLVISDSTVLQRIVSWRMKIPFVPPLRGAELMLEVCRRAAELDVPVALVGGRDEAALARLSARLSQDFPSLRIVCTYWPPFQAPTVDEERDMLRSLRESKARICFVGLGCPKQERWMARHTAELDALLIGVGAAFDQNAGIVKVSPPWVHHAGLEWLHRLLSEPRRLWRRYLTTSPRFLWLLLTESWGSR